MKPYEEEWVLNWHRLFIKGRAEKFYNSECFARFEYKMDSVGEDPRAKLASEAPRMARMLILDEWRLNPDGSYRCPRCHVTRPELHQTSCEWAQTMRAIEYI